MGPNESAIVGLALAGVAFVGLSMWRNPVLRRISLRNVARRKGSTLLVIVGSMVGTALIAGSLVISDTSRRLDQDIAYRHLGETDELVSLPGAGGAERLYFDRKRISESVTVDTLNAVAASSHGGPLVDGAMTVIQELAPVRKVDPDSGKAIQVEPRVIVVALDWDGLAEFGERPPSLTRPARGEILFSPGLARELDVGPGDTVEVLTRNGSDRFTVRAVEEIQGVPGFWSQFIAIEGIPESMLLNLEDGQAVFAGGADHANTVLVSNIGGVTEGHQHSKAVQEALGISLKDADSRGEFQVRPVKSEVLDQDFSIGDMFLTFSLFVIVAGVMLVLNIYAMLAEERRSEMGVMRALGLRREHLVRLYLYEGVLYSLGAAVVGVFVGLGLARLVVWGLNESVFAAAAGADIRLVFTMKSVSLAVAGAAGTLVTLGTVLYTSLRISGINIVAAMRDLPEFSGGTRRRWTVVWPLLVGLVGLALTVLAVTGNDGIMYVLGPSMAALGLALALQRVLPARALLSATYLGLMAYSQLVFLIPAVDEADDNGTATFLTGMILVLSAIGVLVLNFAAVTWLIRQTFGRLRRILPVVRVAIAYPAEKPTRTGFTLGMFSLVIFFATLASIFLVTFIGAAENIERGQVGGFDAIVAVSPVNPVSGLQQRLQQSAEVDSTQITQVSALSTARVELPDFKQADYVSSGEAYAASSDAAFSDELTGLDDVFLRTTKSKLALRAPEYESDRAVWEALEVNRDVVVLGDVYSANTGGSTARW